MLPFPRLVEYGNIAPTTHWYDGSNVIMAFDTNNFIPSTGYNTNGFTDYKNNIMVSDAQTAGTLPALGTSGTSAINTFGSYGILLYGSAIAARNSQIPASLTQQDYTIDFWFRNTASGSSIIEMVPFSWYNTMASNSNKWCMWAYFIDGNGPRFQNNNTNTLRTKSLYSTMYDNTNWNHYAYVFVKSTNTNYIFLNGSLIDSFILNVSSPGTAGSVFAVGGHVNNAGSSSYQTAIDRFRVRNTAVWTSSFNTSTIYP